MNKTKMNDKDKKEIIHIKNVNKFYGNVHVLKNVNLDVKDGEVLVILGPSGSGKSTLLRTINGLESIQGGEVIINGEVYNDVTGTEISREKRAEVGIVFQQFNLYPHLSVLDNVTLAIRKVKKKSKIEAEKIALSMLKRVGLENRINYYPLQLSGGEQQRVAIARSLVMKPKVMLFDEPTSALDVELTNEVFDVLMKLSKEGMTMVVVTHELSFARRVASRVVFIDNGEIIEVGKPYDVIVCPKKDRTKAFMNKIYNEKSNLYVVKRRKCVNVGITDSTPPMCYRNENGELLGFDVDLAKSVAERLNVALNIVEIRNEDRIQSLLTNEIDICIAKLNHTKSRDNLIDYSVSYLQNCKKMLMYKDKCNKISKLSQYNIAYVVGTSTAQEIESYFEQQGIKKPNFIAFKSEIAAFEALKNKVVEGFASDEIILNYYLHMDDENNKFVFHPEVCCYSYFGMGVAENDSEWLNEINNILLDIYNSGNYEKIFNKWFRRSDKKFFRQFEKWSI